MSGKQLPFMDAPAEHDCADRKENQEQSSEGEPKQEIQSVKLAQAESAAWPCANNKNFWKMQKNYIKYCSFY